MKIELDVLARSAILAVAFGAAGTAGGEPAVNPWLANSAYPISHHNAAQTDSTPVDGPSIGKKLTLDDVKTVPLLWSSAPTFKNVGKERIIVAANPAGIVKVRASGEDFSPVSNVPYPGQEDVHADASDERLHETMLALDEQRRKKQDFRMLVTSLWMFIKFNINLSTMPSGSYSVIDKDGFHYTNFNKHYLVKSFDDNRADQPMVPVAPYWWSTGACSCRTTSCFPGNMPKTPSQWMRAMASTL